MAEFSPIVIFVLIVLSVPLQLFFSPNSASDADYYVSRLIAEVREFYEHYFFTDFFDNEFDDDEDNMANVSTEIDDIIDDKLYDKVPTESQDNNNEMFGGSEVPRDPRPPHVKYHVGQVVRHKIHKYRAVIIGWDQTAKAPEWWIKKVHKNKTHWKDLPNYTVIIDTRNRLIPQIGYVVEENIVPDYDVVVHPLVKHYFESFDGKCYTPRPWHRKIYPND